MIKPQACNPHRSLIKGYWYKAIVFSGAEFEFWVERKLKRWELRDVAHEFIGKEIYDFKDIESVRKIKKDI